MSPSLVSTSPDTKSNKLEDLLLDLWRGDNDPSQLNEQNGKGDLDNQNGVITEEVGTLSKVKTLYEGPPKCHCCINWVEDKPDDIKESIEEQSESKKHAILIRMKKNHGDGKPLVLDSVVVQSSNLKELLQAVFEDYSGITTNLKKLVFKPPFHPFFYEWDRFNRQCDEHPNSIAREHAKLLLKVLHIELEETLSISEDLARNKVITFDYLWTIFQAGIDVYTSRNGHDRFYRLTEATYGEVCGEKCFQLKVKSVDCDGQEFGWATSCLAIWMFSGTKPLQDLNVKPASLLSNGDQLQHRANLRGEMSRNLQQSPYHYASYHGFAETVDDHRYKLDGRIIVDAAAFQQFNEKDRVKLESLDSLNTAHRLDVTDKSQDHESDYGGWVCGTSRMNARMRSKSPERQLLPEPLDKRKIPQLPDDKLYLCGPEVRGYCLKTKKWATFYVDSIADIVWNEHAFDNLVMAEGYKRMLLSFVESQAANKDSFDDVIEGKGRGLIMLLEGTPGVGKTLTAEAVADKLRRPLYAISGGELGQDAGALEAALNMILEIAVKWDAILLLDECDVFLEERSTDNLQRNSMVAVFLRLLEHYRGILFMTTNRVDTIDPAFQSRIHLTVRYPRLDVNARRQIWDHFIGKFCSDTTLTGAEIQRLSEVEMNGREIKNLIKTTQLLAKHENNPLAIEHFDTVLSVINQKFPA